MKRLVALLLLLMLAEVASAHISSSGFLVIEVQGRSLSGSLEIAVRDADALRLLNDYRSMEPMLLRVAIAEKRTGASQAAKTDAFLSNAFAVEAQRGDAVHRREQARFLLDVEQQPAQALATAQENWRMQREPDDILILLRSAQQANRPDLAAPALEFLRREKLEDVRLNPYLASTR